MTVVATYHLKRDCGNIRPFCRPCTNSFKVTTCGPVDCDEPPPSVICLKPEFGGERMYVGGNEKPTGTPPGGNGVIWKVYLNGVIQRFYPLERNTFSSGVPVSMETDDDGVLYVAYSTGGSSAHNVYAFHENGTVLWSRYLGIGTSGSVPHALAVDANGILWVAVQRAVSGGLTTNFNLYQLSKTTGDTVNSVGGLGSFGVSELCCDYRGRCYVATLQSRVVCFDTDGSQLWSVAIPGVGYDIRVNLEGTELYIVYPIGFSAVGYSVRLNAADGSVVSSTVLSSVSYACDYSADGSRFVPSLRKVYKNDVEIVDYTPLFLANVGSKAFCRRDPDDLNLYVNIPAYSNTYGGLVKISPSGVVLWSSGLPNRTLEQSTVSCGDQGRIGAFGLIAPT